MSRLLQLLTGYVQYEFDILMQQQELNQLKVSALCLYSDVAQCKTDGLHVSAVVSTTRILLPGGEILGTACDQASHHLQ